jgi:hypothetical protein
MLEIERGAASGLDDSFSGSFATTPDGSNMRAHTPSAHGAAPLDNQVQRAERGRRECQD